jgi:hypothetical protein
LNDRGRFTARPFRHPDEFCLPVRGALLFGIADPEGARRTTAPRHQALAAYAVRDQPVHHESRARFQGKLNAIRLPRVRSVARRELPEDRHVDVPFDGVRGKAEPHGVAIQAAEPCVTHRRGHQRRPELKPTRYLLVYVRPVNRERDQGLAGKATVEEMNQAVRKQHLPADVRAANPEQGPAPALHHVFFDSPREMRVTPVVHVLVGRSSDDAPVNPRVA